MNAEQRHEYICQLADECAALRDNGRIVIEVELIGRVVRFTCNDGRRVRRPLPPEFFALIPPPRY